MTDLQTNVLYYGDNLDILRRYITDASVDLDLPGPAVQLEPRLQRHLPRRVRQPVRCAAARLRGHLALGPIGRVDLRLPDQHRPPRRPRARQGQHDHRRAALRHRREPDDGLPGRDGRPPRRAPPRPQAHRLALPPLRPHREPLPKARAGCDVRTENISLTRSCGSGRMRAGQLADGSRLHDVLLLYARAAITHF